MPFEFTAEKLVYGGEALGHANGHTVLVPGILAGERIRAEAVRTAKGVVHARALEVVEAAPERDTPPCPYFGRCGGCHYQHFDAECQVAAKREILRETLRRIGKVDWTGDIPAYTAHPWGYRNQAELKLGRGDGGLTIGFYEAESHRVCPIDRCLILSPKLNLLVTELQRAPWTERLADCRTVSLLADDRDERVMMTIDFQAGSNRSSDSIEALAQECLSELPGVASITLVREADRRGRGAIRRTFGSAALEYQMGEFRYQVSPGSFFQTSRYLMSKLAAAVTDAQGDLALDLFAGVGLFTLPLARRFKLVEAVEAGKSAAADLVRNAVSYGLGNVRVACEAAFDFLRRFARSAPDLVVLDPPRSGVGAKTLSLLGASGPRHIHYVSCSPPTLARDLQELVRRGYAVDSVELFDFFPQTYHIESLTRLTRRSC